MDFFDGFSLERVDVGTAALRVRVGGSGPCVLLLHGHPRTHTTWYRVAPLLVDAGFTVVCPDLPGYGESRRVAGDFSKQAMAGDLRALMERFGRVRGRRPRPRLARRAPARGRRARATRLAVLDGVPITGTSSAATTASPRRGGTGSSSPRPRSRPRRSSTATRRVVPRRPSRDGAGEPRRLVARGARPRRSCFAMVGDYRAGLRRRPLRRGGRPRRRPAVRARRWWLVAAGRPRGAPRRPGRDLARVGDRAAEGATIDSGHHMAEEAPEELAASWPGSSRTPSGRAPGSPARARVGGARFERATS